MKPFFISISTVLFLAFIAAIAGCDGNSRWEKEQSGLLSQAAYLEHRHSQLNASIDSLWDVTTAQLTAALPSSFPVQDRNIFLKARNADHIRMFMSFKQLAPETQSLVIKAGEYDSLLAAQVRALLAQSQEFEQQKMQFLRKVEQRDTAASRLYADELRTATADLIQKTPPDH